MGRFGTEILAIEENLPCLPIRLSCKSPWQPRSGGTPTRRDAGGRHGVDLGQVDDLGELDIFVRDARREGAHAKHHAGNARLLNLAGIGAHELHGLQGPDGGRGAPHVGASVTDGAHHMVVGLRFVGRQQELGVQLDRGVDVGVLRGECPQRVFHILLHQLGR